MNLVESIFEAITDPAPAPLHVGEVMTVWTYAVAIDEGRALCLFMLNHTTDPDLRRFMEHYVKDVEEPQRRKLNKFLIDEGVTLPPISSDKGKAAPSDIPPGARLTDMEIANLFVAKLAGALQILSTGLIATLRSDVGNMFYSFQNQLLKEGFVLKQTMAKRGWTKVPPAFGVPKVSDQMH